MSADVPLILFDGHCNLCNGSVDFVIRRDVKNRYRFASLQSAAAESLLRDQPEDLRSLNTLVLIEDGRAYQRSTAALRIARYLSFPWPLFYAFFVIPRPIRDAIYNLVARNRYRWFGRRDTCRIPTPEQRARFIG